jgi:hypothetical protein
MLTGLCNSCYQSPKEAFCLLYYHHTHQCSIHLTVKWNYDVRIIKTSEVIREEALKLFYVSISGFSPLSHSFSCPENSCASSIHEKGVRMTSVQINETIRQCLNDRSRLHSPVFIIC